MDKESVRFNGDGFLVVRAAFTPAEMTAISSEPDALLGQLKSMWDWKITIVYKDSAAAFDHDLTGTYKKQLFPDLEKLAKEEAHRWELVIAHRDVMTEAIELN